MKEFHYQCKFCEKRFVHESRFLKHKCTQMIRHEEFKTHKGQIAWNAYRKWMKTNNKIVKYPDSFMHSRYYKAFMNYARFSKKVQLDTNTFMWLMSQYKIQPSLWVTNESYTKYLEHMDRKEHPQKLAKITINTLLKIADAALVDVGEVFNVLHANEVIELVRQRRLTPWILLHSSKFRSFFLNKTTSEEQIILESIIRPNFWSRQFQEQPKLVQLMKTYVTELNL